MNSEISLTGGQINQDIVRIGDTVHRAMGANAVFAHSLLTYLDSVGFIEAPRFLGVDEKGREILTFFEGTVYPGSGHKINDRQLENAAKLIRRYHDITASSKLAGTSEIVAHGELGPHNTVYQGDVPIGLIDWDSAAPGMRLRDFAYAVDCFVDIASKRLSAKEQSRRVKLICNAYGWNDYVEILRDIQGDYHKALENHIRRGNKNSIKIFTDLAAWVDRRTGEMIALLV